MVLHYVVSKTGISVSSYSNEILAVKAEYNRDYENLEQVNIALMVGSKSCIPAYYRYFPATSTIAAP